MASELLLIYLFFVGAAIGSFLNVLIDRLPNDQHITGRSHCDNCQKNLSWLDLFPIFSYLYLGGRCRYCNKRLSVFYPAFEIFTGLVFVFTWLAAPIVIPPLDAFRGIEFVTMLVLWQKIIYLGIVSTLLVIFLADLKYQIIPDSMQVSLIVLSIILILLTNGLVPFPTMKLGMQVLAGLGVMAPILFLYLMTKGRGMGFGDVKLAFGIGLLFGFFHGLFVLYAAFIIGGLYGVMLLATKKKKMKSMIAFGPFLVIGMLVALFAAPQVKMVLYLMYGI